MIRTTYSLTVRGYELDSFGHVNNSVYLQYSETALWNFFKVSGLLDVILGMDLFPVILESKQRYMHELRLLDEVEINTELSCTCGIVTYKHTMINKNTGMISCKVTGKLVYVNKERIICDVPDEIKEYLENNENEDRQR